MANCYNLQGEEISCLDNYCVGEDCTAIGGDDGNGQNTVGGVNVTTWGNPDNSPYGLEGLTNMSSEEFDEWFQDYMPWGETFTGLVNPGAEDPQLVSEQRASFLASLFQGYNPQQEWYINQQMAETEAEQQELYDIWEMNTDMVITQEQNRQLQEKDKKKEIFLMQEDYSTQIQALQNRGELVAATKRKRELDSATGGKEGIYGAQEEKLMESTVNNILDEWYKNEDFEGKRLESKIDLMDLRHTNTVLSMELNKEKNKREKLQELESNLVGREINAHKKILELREDFEADVYSQIATLSATGAFFNNSDPEEPNNVTCTQVDNNNNCLNWEFTDDAGNTEVTEEGGGLCNFECADGCFDVGPCGDGQIAESIYYEPGINCCPGADNDDSPPNCCSYNILGQCVQDGYCSCIGDGGC